MEKGEKKKVGKKLEEGNEAGGKQVERKGQK